MKVETIPDRRLMGVRIAAPGFCIIIWKFMLYYCQTSVLHILKNNVRISDFLK